MDDYGRSSTAIPKACRPGRVLSGRTIGLVAAVSGLAVSAPPIPNCGRSSRHGWVKRFTMPLPTRADLIVPFFKSVSYPLGVWASWILTWAVIVDTSNAVNLTDGLDGWPSCLRSWSAAPWGIFASWLAASIIPSTCCSRTFRRVELMVLCAAIGARAWPSCGSTPIRRKVHGRCRRAGAGRRAGHHRGDRAPNRTFIMGGVFVVETLPGHGAGHLVQIHQAQVRLGPADIPHGAAASPFRGGRLKETRSSSVLDHHH